ncbi:hypothetical protein B0H14DRAFT_2562109 [Mycena olivaceomarginata]|nr:hypothetical protein B0H14DRAFT_2562109 [Mycena olivaceomarginata]
MTQKESPCRPDILRVMPPVWPANLVNCALFDTLCSQYYSSIGTRSGLSREHFVLYAFLGSSAWCFFPGHIFQAHPTSPGSPGSDPTTPPSLNYSALVFFFLISAVAPMFAWTLKKIHLEVSVSSSNTLSGGAVYPTLAIGKLAR